MTPTLEQYREAVFSNLLSAGNLKAIGLVFLISLIMMYFFKFIKSLLVKILVAFLITVIFSLYLYFKIGANIRF